MVIAGFEDKGLVVEILTAAFLDNKSVNDLIPQDGLRLYRIHKLMGYGFEVCMRFGKVFLCEDRKGCALLLFPELRRFGLGSLWLDVKLVFGVIGLGKVFRAMRREKLIAGKQPSGRGAYLWFIGVDPRYQRFGLGRRLLSEVLVYCSGEGRAVFLETSTVENLPWYKKFGFEVYDTLQLSYRLYFLKRPMH